MADSIDEYRDSFGVTTLKEFDEYLDSIGVVLVSCPICKIGTLNTLLRLEGESKTECLNPSFARSGYESSKSHIYDTLVCYKLACTTCGYEISLNAQIINSRIKEMKDKKRGVEHEK